MVELTNEMNTKKILEGLVNFLFKKGVLRIQDLNIILANSVKPKIKVENELTKEE